MVDWKVEMLQRDVEIGKKQLKRGQFASAETMLT